MPIPPGTSRRCTGCGGHLSRYNNESECYACHRVQYDKRSPGLVVPDEAWADPKVRRALCQWDLGTVVRLVREHTGLRQSDIADAAGLTQSLMSRAEAGTRRLQHIDHIIDVLDALGVPDHLLPLPRHFPAASPGHGSPGTCPRLARLRHLRPSSSRMRHGTAPLWWRPCTTLS
jgi:transcriptional regulator with XRE-family HTH domain